MKEIDRDYLSIQDELILTMRREMTILREVLESARLEQNALIAFLKLLADGKNHKG